MQAAAAAQLVAAIEVRQAPVVSATLTTSDSTGVGIGTAGLGRFFPRQGGTFAILSTGLASSAEAPNDSESTSTVLGGLDTGSGEDMVQLRIVLAPPPGAQCLGFDFGFFSEEFPEFVNSPFNDVLLAELGGSTFQISGTTITAPLNFAVDRSWCPASSRIRWRWWPAARPMAVGVRSQTESSRRHWALGLMSANNTTRRRRWNSRTTCKDQTGRQPSTRSVYSRWQGVRFEELKARVPTK